ncbi:hypothetical protein JCM18918_2031 [Cutibacterium acnes JCM 18918]|nr:hypothetical protein JCM18918_2031 [Cutibacterium acnes JCM 18918]
MDGHPERLGIIVEQSPNRTQIKRLVDPMNLDPLLAEDLAEGHQRPKLERHARPCSWCYIRRSTSIRSRTSPLLSRSH